MTRRIRDFMTNTSTTDDQLHSHTDQDHQNDSESNRNFGIPLEKCEPSSTSPVRMIAFFEMFVFELMIFLKTILFINI